MYTITIYSDQVPSHKQVLKICWTQKGPNLDQKVPKMGVARFFRDCKPQFIFLYKKSAKFNERFGRYKPKCWFWGKKGQIWTKKGPKWAGLDFSLTVNISFLKEDHKISFYTQNQQNSMYCLEDISQNVDFGPKRGKFGLKGPKMSGTRFFPVLSLNYFIKRPEMQFKYAKLRRSYDSFPRNWPKCPFLG